MLDKVIEKISEQQKGIENTAAYAVGEHLKDIIKETPAAAEIVLQDLELKEMSIIECEKKIKALADKRHNESKLPFAFVSPKESDEIIRNFYGIPAGEDKNSKDNNIIDLSNYI